MNQNTKPQVLNLGNRVIDGESITGNVTAIDALSAKSKWIFGKSSPMVTDHDILERELLTDSNYCNAIERAIRETGIDSFRGTVSGYALDGVDFDSGDEYMQEPPTDGNQEHRYIVSFDLLVHYGEP